MKEDFVVYVFENERGDEITFKLYENGHLEMIYDFLRPFDEESMLEFAEISGYKPKKMPLRLIKK